MKMTNKAELYYQIYMYVGGIVLLSESNLGHCADAQVHLCYFWSAMRFVPFSYELTHIFN